MAAAAGGEPAITTRPAATVVIFRHAADGGPPELLMVQRSLAMRFAGGAAVFPGGRIDPSDRALAAKIAAGADQDVAAARIAGIRETLEETGLAIALDRPITPAEAVSARAHAIEANALAPALNRVGRSIVLDRLVPFAHWCPQWDGAFDTRFFLYDLGTGAVDVEIDATENTRLFWASARDVLTMADAGECQVIFPTRRNLERLALFGSFAEAAEHAGVTPIERISPQRVERDGVVRLTIPEGLGYPVISQLIETVRRG